MVTKEDNKLIIKNIHESSLIDSAAEQWDSFQREAQDKALDDQGICFYCGQPKKDCHKPGYKCFK